LPKLNVCVLIFHYRSALLVLINGQVTVMRSNWSFRIGVALFVVGGFVFMSGSPVALGMIGVACIAFLLAGLFRYAISELGVVQLVLYTLLTAFMILLAGRGLFVVVESLTRDASADIYAAYVILSAWLAALTAFIHGIIRRVRKRRTA
jgi:hypothetical protein